LAGAPRLPCHLEAIHPRHADVEQRHVRWLSLDLVQRIGSVVELPHPVIGTLERGAQQRARGEVIFGDDDGRRFENALQSDKVGSLHRLIVAQASPDVSGTNGVPGPSRHNLSWLEHEHNCCGGMQTHRLTLIRGGRPDWRRPGRSARGR
jgi:hypothetical protein